jgi:hypothetical protein
MRFVTVSGVLFAVSLITAGLALANGGPFVVKYPGGDPAAKGVLARLDPTLKPAREERLRVISEDLEISFANDGSSRQEPPTPPLARVSAAYVIENPTEEQIEVDFGFPILRGIYVNRLSMVRRPAVGVSLNNHHLDATIISNSVIYGVIRQQAREVIEQALAEDPTLAELVATVRATRTPKQRAGKTGKKVQVGDTGHQAARAALADHLRGSRHWNERDAALMVEFASLDLGNARTRPPDRPSFPGWRLVPGSEIPLANLGPLSAIGEQKATQFFAQLAGCFEPEAASTYESIFTAWGGDVRERSVDLQTGALRPREITIDIDELASQPAYKPGPLAGDPTIYARVDYLDPKANISEAEKISCKAVLKNLPVIFTFAPMNLLHYRATFPPKATQTLTVTYSQYAYADTRAPSSYQLAYVVHPASLWNEFGPINLKVVVPEGVPFRASVPCETAGTERHPTGRYGIHTVVHREMNANVYRAQVEDKTGELFLAIDAEAWKKVISEQTDATEAKEHARR